MSCGWGLTRHFVYIMQADIAEASAAEQAWVEQLRQSRQIYFVPRGEAISWVWGVEA